MSRHRLAQGIVAAVIVLMVAGGSRVLAREDVSLAQTDADSELVAAGAGVYTASCSSCHQSGGVGIPGAFPPLLANPNAEDVEYVASVVRDGLSGPLDVLGVSYDATMPAVDMSDSDVEAVAAYVRSLALRDTSAPTPTTAPARPGDAVLGKDLFTGATSFINGGASCSSCHTAGSVGDLGGWTLGPNLTNSLAAFGGEAGMSAWLGNPSSQTMIPVFLDHELTDVEIADIVAFLADAPNQSEPSYFGDALLWAGLAGLIVLLGGMAVAWRGMRQTYVEKLRGARP